MLKNACKFCFEYLMVFCVALCFITVINVGAEENDEFMLMKPLITSAQLVNLDINISILYDSEYCENVLLPGKQLTAELTAKNKGSESKRVQYIIAIYDDTNKLIGIKSNSKSIAPLATEPFSITITVPQGKNASSATLLIWDNLVSDIPNIPVVMHINSMDFFGDDYTIAQSLLNSYSAIGSINTPNDVDVFEFTPLNDGLYIFESFGTTDTYASLYKYSDMTTPIKKDESSGVENNFRLSHTLEKNVKYYLYIKSHGMGDYSLHARYAVGNVIGTVIPIKHYENDPEFNENMEAKVTLTTFDTNEFVATMHLKEWSTSSSSYAPLDMTGIHGGIYLVRITRPGYLTWYMKVELNDRVRDLGTVELLAGDVDGNGIINNTDSNLLKSLYGKQYGQPGYLFAADLNGDKIINNIDLTLLTPNLGKNVNNYMQDINFITANASRTDSILTISGIALAKSLVTVNVYKDGAGFDTQTVTATSTGSYSATCNLSTSGKYQIVVTSENRAVDATAEIIY